MDFTADNPGLDVVPLPSTIAHGLLVSMTLFDATSEAKVNFIFKLLGFRKANNDSGRKCTLGGSHIEGGLADSSSGGLGFLSEGIQKFLFPDSLESGAL